MRLCLPNGIIDKPTTMNGRISKRLRRKAETLTVGQGIEDTRAMYKQLKKDYAFESQNPDSDLSKNNPTFDSPHTFKPYSK